MKQQELREALEVHSRLKDQCEHLLPLHTELEQFFSSWTCLQDSITATTHLLGTGDGVVSEAQLEAHLTPIVSANLLSPPSHHSDTCAASEIISNNSTAIREEFDSLMQCRTQLVALEFALAKKRSLLVDRITQLSV